MKYLISGGGTGGHIFPAVSIANALREIDPSCEILFVGALGRMEMERVPQAGYQIVGLPVKGFDRSHPWKNIRVVIDLLRSMCQARKIVRDFRPDVGVGVGGYASGAAMKVAAKMGVPILLQEQNGFAGVTNKLLKDDAKKICVAYEGMERFFSKEKIILTGNPVRQNLTAGTKEEALNYFNKEFGVNFTADKKTLLIIGGSLGARTINQSIIAHLNELIESGIQVIWQTGKNYFAGCKEALADNLSSTSIDRIICTDFVSQMPLAYALADLVISRAGASSISELCLLGKPSILVPSPNVAEDHQTHNAMALVKKNAAVLVKDQEAQNSLIATALQLINNDQQLHDLHTNILTLALPDSARIIAEEVIKLAQQQKSDMKQYKAVLIDWDDTIGDFAGAANTALHEMYEKHLLGNYFESYEEFDTLYHEHNMELWKLYGEDKVTKAFLRVDRFLYPLSHGSKVGDSLLGDEVLTSMAEQMSEDFLYLTTKYFSLLPEAEELVRYLAKKYPLTVVTNGFIEVQYEKFDKSGLRDCFAHIVLSEEVGCQKPNPRIYEEALRMNGVSAEEAVMIGDSWNSDIQGAINASIDQIWVRKSKDPLPEGQSATYLVQSLSEVMDIL